MDKDLDITDIKLIIRNLITFIIIEGKEYVNDSKKKEYVLGYMKLLINTMNLVEEDHKESLLKDIAEDITTYVNQK
ncbi:hypothetical protein [Aquimarina algicola]|uniref:Uncharacterized protein n=1 Tax=Aquimarina algicola TaxID=2589995 RepID=A0A504JBQ1_9FLAO|nr:hypothetical protein [Aquimarina algicola]TPN85972.1 hypothetical protein FHK87_11870 [Aquimarina algicola]